MTDAPNLLMLDFDRELFIEETLEAIRDKLHLIGVPFLRIECERSCSGDGYHFVVILFDNWPLVYRIAMQAICGSDLTREAINLHRCTLGVNSPDTDRYKNLLFKSKETVVVSTHGRHDENTSTPESSDSR